MIKIRTIAFFFIILQIFIYAEDSSSDSKNFIKKSLIKIKKLENNEGRRIAICVGINEFLDKSIFTLSKARNDAKSIGNLLAQYGQFDNVYIMTDDLDPKNDVLFPYRANILSKIDNIVQICNSADFITLFYSSHGISDANGEGYLATFDTISNNFFETSIKISDVVFKFQTKKISKTLLLIDACRESFQKTKSLSYVGLKEKIFKNSEVAATFYATKQGLFSYEDNDSDFGVFTRYLIEGLSGRADSDDNGYVTFSEIEFFTGKSLTEWSLKNNKNQIPFTKIYGEKYGDLILTEYKSNTSKNEQIENKVISNIGEDILKSIDNGIIEYTTNLKEKYSGYGNIDLEKFLSIYNDVLKKMGRETFDTWNDNKAIYENSRFTVLTSEFLNEILGDNFEIFYSYEKSSSSSSGIIHNYVFAFAGKNKINYNILDIKKNDDKLSAVISFPNINPLIVTYSYSFKRSPNGILSAVKYYDEYYNFSSLMKIDLIKELNKWSTTDIKSYDDENTNTKINYYHKYNEYLMKQNYPASLIDKKKLNKEMFDKFLLNNNNLTKIELNKFIKEGADINYQSEDTGNSMLYIASVKNNYECVINLIDLGAYMNIINKQGQTPLLIASSKGNYDIVKILLENGANPNIQEKDTELTALDNAIAGDYIKSESNDSLIIDLSIGRNENFKKCAEIIKRYGGETYYPHIAIPYKITLARYERDILNKIKNENDEKFISSIYKQDKKHMIILNELSQDERNRIRKIMKDIKFSSLGYEKKRL